MSSIATAFALCVFFIMGFWVGVHWQIERFKRGFR